MIENTVNDLIFNITSVVTLIEEKYQELAELEKEKLELQKIIKQIETQVELDIAFDTNLKNDRQRNAKKESLLMTNPEYQESKNKLDNIQKQIIEVKTKYEIFKKRLDLYKTQLKTLLKVEELKRMEVIDDRI